MQTDYIPPADAQQTYVYSEDSPTQHPTQHTARYTNCWESQQAPLALTGPVWHFLALIVTAAMTMPPFYSMLRLYTDKDRPNATLKLSCVLAHMTARQQHLPTPQKETDALRRQGKKNKATETGPVSIPLPARWVAGMRRKPRVPSPPSQHRTPGTSALIARARDDINTGRLHRCVILHGHRAPSKTNSTWVRALCNQVALASQNAIKSPRKDTPPTQCSQCQPHQCVDQCTHAERPPTGSDPSTSPHAVPANRGGTNRPRSTARPTTTAHTQPNTTQIYHERQHRRNCQVHSWNNMLGRRDIDDVDMMRFMTCLDVALTAETTDHPMPGHAPYGLAGTHYSPGDGNYMTSCLNAYVLYRSMHRGDATTTQLRPCRAFWGSAPCTPARHPGSRYQSFTRQQIELHTEGRAELAVHFETPPPPSPSAMLLPCAT